MVCCPKNILCFDIPLLYCYINLRSLIIWFIFLRYIPFFWYFSIKSCIFCFTFNYFLNILWWKSWDYCNFVSNFIASQITICFCCFMNSSFWSSFKFICVADSLEWSKSFWMHLLFKLVLIFLPMFFSYFYQYLI